MQSENFSARGVTILFCQSIKVEITLMYRVATGKENIIDDNFIRTISIRVTFGIE